MADNSYLQFLGDLQNGLGNLKTELLNYVVAASAIGVTSMALIQTLKDQLPLRKWYQHWRIRQWIAEGLESVASKVKGAPVPSDAEIAGVERDMVTLALDGDAKAFYALDIDKLCGQLNAAAQSALQAPAAHKDLLAVLASEADTGSLKIVLDGLPATQAGVTLLPSDPAVQSYTTARTQVGQQIQRAIDALQLSITADWQVHLQQAALVLSVLLAWAAAHISNSLKASPQLFLFTVFTGVMAGFLAPVARDLIAALQNLRS